MRKNDFLSINKNFILFLIKNISIYYKYFVKITNIKYSFLLYQTKNDRNKN
jgi:hypothetical protein